MPCGRGGTRRRSWLSLGEAAASPCVIACYLAARTERRCRRLCSPPVYRLRTPPLPSPPWPCMAWPLRPQAARPPASALASWHPPHRAAQHERGGRQHQRRGAGQAAGAQGLQKPGRQAQRQQALRLLACLPAAAHLRAGRLSGGAPRCCAATFLDLKESRPLSSSASRAWAGPHLRLPLYRLCCAQVLPRRRLKWVPARQAHATRNAACLGAGVAWHVTGPGPCPVGTASHSHTAGHDLV